MSLPETLKVSLPEWAGILFQPSRFKAIYGGRASAKSHSFATALEVLAVQKPLRILCCREIQRSIHDSVKRLLDDKRQALGLEEFYTSTHTELRGANGSTFLFAGLKTNTVESIKSMEAIDIAWVSEAHKVSQESLNVLIPTIRAKNSEIWFDWNPYLPTDPVDRMFRGDHPPDDSLIRAVTWRDNPWFPEVLTGDLERDRRYDPAKYQHVWEGGYRQNAEAQVFTNWRIGDEEEFKPADDTTFYYGGDWGFSNDPTALVRCWLDGRTLYIDYEAWQIGCEIDKTPALFDRVPGSRKWPITADSARPETISYLQRNGFPKLRAATKGAGSVEDGIEFLKTFDIVVHPRCTHTADEFTYYSYKTDAAGGVLPVLVDAKNHIIDSLRYALEVLMKKKELVFW